MIVVPYQDVMREKLARQAQIKELQYHGNGHCVHIGKISPGCRRCFTGEAGSGIQIGAKCMCNCPYCYYDPQRLEEPKPSIYGKLADFFQNSFNPDWKPTIFSYQSSGETLMYMDDLEKFAAILNRIEQNDRMTHYYYVYTNGILANQPMLERLQAIGAHELRFHLSASHFSKQVYRNMELAAKMGFSITVEEPSWPQHREELFDLLPVLDSIGANHLDMVEIQITVNNRDAIEQCYPGDTARAYKDYLYHLYDEGLVYDLMEEVIKKDYKFSVIDCSSAVERCRHAKDQAVLFDPKTMDGACADWDYFTPNSDADFYKKNIERRLQNDS